LPIDEDGAAGSDAPLPIFDAIGFTFKPSTRAVRPGSKRIAGIPQSTVTKGKVTDAGYITIMNNARVAMGNSIGTEPDMFSPCIVKRTKTAIPDTEPVKYRYTLPKAGDTLVVATVVAVLQSTKVTHQVSRGN
jgi:hypothetical protein